MQGTALHSAKMPSYFPPVLFWGSHIVGGRCSLALRDYNHSEDQVQFLSLVAAREHICIVPKAVSGILWVKCGK